MLGAVSDIQAPVDGVLATALPARHRPHRVVDDIPTPQSYRPTSSALRAAGMPKPGAKIWYRDDAGRYRRYTRSTAADLDGNFGG